MYPQIFGKYVLERELSSGGMARVFVATLRGAVGFEKRLAVKQIRPELASDPRFVERFVQEAKTAVELTHPNIVPVYELGVEGGVYFIAMELCPGVTLAELLATTGALGFEAGAYLGIEVARALDYAHRRAGILHQDVTPRNILIDDEGAVRLIDFGIARPVAAAGASEVFGSPGHMPPEQVRGDALGPSADVFALGALVIEACTGNPPFRRDTERDSLLAVESLPEPPSRADPELEPLDAVLLAAVEPAVADRLQAIDDVGRALREALRGADLGDVARSLGSRVRALRRTSRPDAQSVATPAVLPTAGSLTRTFATRPLIGGEAEGGASPSEEITRPLEPVVSSAAGPSRTLAVGAMVLGFVLVAGWLAFGVRGDAPQRSPVSDGSQASRAVVRAAAAPDGTVAASSAAPSSAVPSAPATSAAAPSSPTAGKAAEVPGPVEPGSEKTPRSAANSERMPPADTGRTVSAAAAVSGSAAAALGTVTLTSAPAARVTIAGRRLSTPVGSLELPAGDYRAIFTSPAWDGPISARIQLEEGGSRHVHADFTSEPPRVLVR